MRRFGDQLQSNQLVKVIHNKARLNNANLTLFALGNLHRPSLAAQVHVGELLGTGFNKLPKDKNSLIRKLGIWCYRRSQPLKLIHSAQKARQNIADLIQFLHHLRLIFPQQVVDFGAESSGIDDQVLQIFVVMVLQPFDELLMIQRFPALNCYYINALYPYSLVGRDLQPILEKGFAFTPLPILNL